MAKDKFTFGSIFNASVDEYKRNFKPIFKFMLLFVGITILVFSLLEFIIIASSPVIFNMMSVPSMISQLNEGAIKFPFYYWFFVILSAVVIGFLTMFISVGLINASLKKSKFSFRELIRLGNVRYWKYFLFGIVSGIFTVLLFLALIVPGIIFMVYWAFGVYIFMDKKSGIRASLKQSRMMLKGRWWKTFGYGLLMILICIGVYIVFSIIKVPTSLIYASHIKNNVNLSLGFLGIQSLLDVIYRFVVSFITTPLAIFFFKNYYLEVKKVYKERETPKRNKKRRK